MGLLVVTMLTCLEYPPSRRAVTLSAAPVLQWFLAVLGVVDQVIEVAVIFR